MPESHDQTNPALGAKGRGLSVTNSTAKKKNPMGRYHDIASTLFGMGKSGDLNELFLAAARDGDLERMEMFLRRRGDALVSVDVKDKRTGNTPIIWAAKRGHIKIVQLLLRNGADITLKNYDGQTAVEIASPQIRALLLKSIEQQGSSHRVLLQAAWQGNTRLVRKILSENKKVDINCRNADGLTPLLLVTRDVHLFEKLGDEFRKGYDPVTVVNELLSHRADPNLCDEEKKSPLHYASLSKANIAGTIARTLISDGSNHDMQDCRCFTPIHCASQSGNSDVVVALLDGGSDVNARGFAGATPLHVSAINGHERVATTLLEHGADVSLVDDSGATPLDVAKNKKVKATLKTAWTEITQRKIETHLSPVRTPSKDILRSSLEEPIGAVCKSKAAVLKKKGEVIFDSLINVQDDSEDLSAAVQTLPTPAMNVIGNLTPRRASLIKQLSNAERGKKAEEEMLRELTSCSQIPPALSRETSNLRRQALTRGGPFRHSFGGTPQGRVTPNKGLYPLKSRTPRKTISDLSNDSNEDSGRDSSLSVAVLGLEIDDNMQDIKVKRIPQTTPSPAFKVRHKRLMSYPTQSPSPCPTNVLDLAAGCDEFLLRGISPTKSTVHMNYDDMDDHQEVPRNAPLRTPSGGNRQRLRIPDTIQEGSLNPMVLDLDKLNITNKLQCRSQVLPTPDMQLIDISQDLYGGSSKESSPRDEDDDEYEDFRLAITNPEELMRSKSLLKEDFNIEESRVNNTSAKTLQSTSVNPPTSNRSSLSSSGISTMSTSPEPPGGEHQQQQQTDARDVEDSNKKKKSSAPISARLPSSSKQKIEKTSAKSRYEDTAYKLQIASKQNALQKKSVSPPNVDMNPSSHQRSAGSMNRVTVYSSNLLKDTADNKKSPEQNHNVFLTQGVDDQSDKSQSMTTDGSTVVTVAHGNHEKPTGATQDHLNLGQTLYTELQFTGSQAKTQSTPTITVHEPTPIAPARRSKANNSATGAKTAVMTANVNDSKKTGSANISSSLQKQNDSVQQVAGQERIKEDSNKQADQSTKESSGSASGKKIPVSAVSNRSAESGSAVKKSTVNEKPSTSCEKKPALGTPSSGVCRGTSSRKTPRGSVTVMSTPRTSANQNARSTVTANQTKAQETPRPGTNKGPNRQAAPPRPSQPPKTAQNTNTTARNSSASVSRPSSTKVPPPRPSQPPIIRGKTPNNLGQESAAGGRAGARSTGQILDTEKSVNDRVFSAKSVNSKTPLRPPPPAANKNCWVQSNSGEQQYDGPIIRDPFESLKARINLAENQSEPKPEGMASKSRSNLKSASNKNKQKTALKPKPESRQKSDVKKKTLKSKTNKSGQSGQTKNARVTSGRRKKSGKTKGRESPPIAISKDEVIDIALISGINWHIKTERAEQPADMLILRSDSESSSSDDEEQQGDNSTPRIALQRLSPRVHSPYSVPGAVHSPQLKRSLKRGDSIESAVTRPKSPRLDEGPTLIPQTVNAIKEFSKAVQEDSLMQMLGVQNDSVSTIVNDPQIVNQSVDLDFPPHSLNRSKEKPFTQQSFSSSGSDSMKDNNHNVTGKSKRNRSKVKDKGDSTGELEEAIDEIMKTTPSLNRSLSLKQNKTQTPPSRGSFSMKISPRSSDGEKSFREIQRIPHKEPVVTHRSDSDPERLQEEACLQRMMDSIGRLKLRADRADLLNSSYGAKSSFHEVNRMENSPRFVRRHTPTTGRKVQTERFDLLDSDSDSDDSLASEALGGTIDSVNEALSETARAMLNNPEARVVTSRLGRGSAAQSRSASACTNDTHNTDPDDVIKWKKGNMLGKGAFGTVWCGLTNAGELIAVKQIELNTNDMDKAEREYENIQEEVEILKHLTHKNIVSYLGTSLEDYTVSIFMQFVPGGSVANLLARFGALEEEIFCHYTRQILEGTEYLHINGVIHRDIKGGNVMLMPNGVIKLIDFGCAKKLCINLQTSTRDLLKSMRGTPYWMAPEVVNETGHGTKSDIWSIGCTVFEMATMKPPWADMTAMAAIFAIGSDHKPIPQLPDKFSQQVRDFVNVCLTRDQKKRPSATDLLKHTAMQRNKKQTKKVV